MSMKICNLAQVLVLIVFVTAFPGRSLWTTMICLWEVGIAHDSGEAVLHLLAMKFMIIMTIVFYCAVDKLSSAITRISSSLLT